MYPASFFRSIPLAFLLTIIGLSAAGQSIQMDWLVNLSAESPDKQVKTITGKKFLRSGGDTRGDTVIAEWQQAIRKRKKGKQYEERLLSTYLYKDDGYVWYRTTSADEYNEALEWFGKREYKQGRDTTFTSKGMFFQKQNIAVQSYITKVDTTDVYNFFVWNLYVPGYSEITTAEDLLQFRSQELLSGFYGRQNVRNDLYYFSKDEVNKCSILYPNTPKQVVFLWKNEENMFGLANIIIGGSVRTEGTSDFNNQIRENTWRLKNGIGINTGLETMVDINGKDMNIFGRNTDYYLTIVPQNTGVIDGYHTGFVMDCINCQGSQLLEKDQVSAKEAVSNSLRMHVGLIILMPPSPNVKSSQP